MAVKVGDRVKLVKVIFSDKKTEGVNYTAPGAGVVKAINRGDRRVLQSVEIELEGDDAVEFNKYSAGELSGLTREQVEESLIASGLWTALRTRPFSRVPQPGSTPNSIFVTAMDTNPLAADPVVVIAEQKEAFSQGLEVLTCLAATVYLCKASGADIPTADGVTVEEFEGCHPAGNAGTHIHFLDPVSQHKTVWTIGYQDVIAVGKLFTEGKLFTDRVVSVAGPRAASPSLLRTRLGASFSELLNGAEIGTNNRVISGSVWSGRAAAGPTAFLSRYANQGDHSEDSSRI